MEPTVDGCGTHRQTWNYWYIHWIGNTWKFTPICNEHDRCYGTCNTNRAACDNSFCSELDASCKVNWGTDPLDYYTCLDNAKTFCWFIEVLGSGAFIDAQNQDCWCDKTWFPDKSLNKENKQ
jgi:secretory phospholipase A2